MEEALGESFARVWAETNVMSSLGGRTPAEALAAGEEPKLVWAAVWADRELPARLR